MADTWRGEATSVSGGTVPPETPTIETVEAAGPPSTPGEAASGSDGETKADDVDADPEAEPTGNDSDGEEEIDELALRSDKVVPRKRARVAAPVRRGLFALFFVRLRSNRSRRPNARRRRRRRRRHRRRLRNQSRKGGGRVTSCTSQSARTAPRPWPSGRALGLPTLSVDLADGSTNLAP